MSKKQIDWTKHPRNQLTLALRHTFGHEPDFREVDQVITPLWPAFRAWVEAYGWPDQDTNPSSNDSLAWPEQDAWRALKARMGSEKEARKELARKLRLAADHVEKGGFPEIFGCFCEPGDLCSNSFIERISVTFSYPWPG